MGEALSRFLPTRADIGGVIGAGGSGNTALVAQGMRALPIGLPKVLVSTVASGNVAPYVGPNDITMMYSVVDVAGLNRISRVVLANAAHALAGMMRGERAGGRGQARDRADHVRRDHALRRPGARAAGGALRLPGLPRDRDRRHVNGEAGRVRPGAGLHRQHHHRGLRPAHGRRLQRRPGPARRLRTLRIALCGLLRRAGHGQFRRHGDRAREISRQDLPRAQSQCHADAHDGGGEPGHGRMDRRQAQRLRRAGALPDPGEGGLADRRAGDALPRPGRRRGALRGAGTHGRGDRRTRRLVRLPLHINDADFAAALVESWHEIAP